MVTCHRKIKNIRCLINLEIDCQHFILYDFRNTTFMQTAQAFTAMYKAEVLIHHSRITNNPRRIPAFGGIYITTSAYNESSFVIEDNVFEQQVSSVTVYIHLINIICVDDLPRYLFEKTVTYNLTFLSLNILFF